MPSRLSGYIEKLFLLRNIYTYTLHIYTTIKIYRIHLPQLVKNLKTIFSNSLLENTCNNTVNLEILLV